MTERSGEPQKPTGEGIGPAAMAKWLAPTAESRIERISVRAITDREWPPDDDAADLGPLRVSITSHGIVEPLLLRTREGGQFQVVTGARRLRVAREIGLATVPAIVRDIDDVSTIVATLWAISGRQRLTAPQADHLRRRLVEAGLEPEDVRAVLDAAMPPKDPFVVDAPRIPERRRSATLAARPRHARFMTAGPPTPVELPDPALAAVIPLLTSIDPSTVLHPDA